jgi:hypothetical protein
MDRLDDCTSDRNKDLSAPETKAGRLQRIVLDLLREHHAAGEIPTSARFLYYELVQRGILSKEKTGAQRTDQPLHVALTRLRQIGLVPWDWITDETRSLDDHSGWSSIAAAAQATAGSARLDPWDGSAPLILTESRSLSGVLRNLAVEYAVKIAATNGQVGGFLYTDIAPVLFPGDTILYIGDHDWQGHQIEANTRKVLECEVGELDWERIALTEAQVEEHELGHLRISKPDKRYKPVRHHYAVETEALSQSVIVDIVRSALEERLPEPLTDVHERAEAERVEVLAVLGRRS